MPLSDLFRNTPQAGPGGGSLADLAGGMYTEDMSPSEMAILRKDGPAQLQALQQAAVRGGAPGALISLQRPRRDLYPGDEKASSFAAGLDSLSKHLMLVPGLSSGALGGARIVGR